MFKAEEAAVTEEIRAFRTLVREITAKPLRPEEVTAQAWEELLRELLPQPTHHATNSLQ